VHTFIKYNHFFVLSFPAVFIFCIHPGKETSNIKMYFINSVKNSSCEGIKTLWRQKLLTQTQKTLSLGSNLFFSIELQSCIVFLFIEL